MLPLRELQLRFLATLTAGARDAGAAPADRGTLAIDPALLGLVRGVGALDPAERLQIYADMYCERLVDVLREDFPRLLAVLGDREFRALACRYLARYPSTHASVRHVGRRLGEYLRAEPALPPFLADLARLEWARGEVFDAPDAVPLEVADLQSIAPGDWPALRLLLVPACLVVESPWPLHRIWAEADTPADGRPLAYEPEATTLRVWREGWSVSHAAMGAPELRAFRALQRGESFADLCAALEVEGDAEAAARDMGAILLRWIEDGLLTGLDRTPAAP